MATVAITSTLLERIWNYLLTKPRYLQWVCYHCESLNQWKLRKFLHPNHFKLRYVCFNAICSCGHTYSETSDKGHSERGQTSEQRTNQKYSSITYSIQNNLRKRTTSLQRTKSWVPNVSIIRRFHCSIQYCRKQVRKSRRWMVSGRRVREALLRSLLWLIWSASSPLLWRWGKNAHIFSSLKTHVFYFHVQVVITTPTSSATGHFLLPRMDYSKATISVTPTEVNL